MAVYMACAGSVLYNGIYDRVSSDLYYKRGSGGDTYITYGGSLWIAVNNIYGNAGYGLERPFSDVQDVNIISDTGWTNTGGLAGSLPLPKTYGFTHSLCGKIIISGSGEPSVNGEYILQSGVGGVPFYTKGSSFSLEYDDSIDAWILYYSFVGEGTALYIFDNGVISEPPIGQWASANNMSSVFPGSSDGLLMSDLPGTCPDCGTGGGEIGGSGSGNYFIYRNNNASYIKKTGNNFFIRKT